MAVIRRSVILISAALVGLGTAADLAEVCTVDYVRSAIPAANAINGLVPKPETVTVNSVYNYTVSAASLWPRKEGVSFCNVTFAYGHAGLDDNINLWYWLPAPDEWSGRYLTTGGGGLAITSGQAGLPPGPVYGAVSGTTDGGYGSWRSTLQDVILLADGSINYNALHGHGYRSIHELTVVGKGLTAGFYGTSDFYSYYQGCSEGGREGLSQIQRYGDQFDGAALGAPAIRLPLLQVAHLASSVVETIHGYYPSSCELQRIVNDTIEACDSLDGKVDGVVSRTDLCRLNYDATSAVGKAFDCAAGRSEPAQSGTVSEEAAAIANEILGGLVDSKGRLVYPLYQPSTPFADAATRYDTATGQYTAQVAAFGSQWVNQMLRGTDSTELSLENVTSDTLRGWILEGVQKYQDTLHTAWADLEDAQNSGAKIIQFHGEADSAIPPISSTIYHDSVRKATYPGLDPVEGYEAMNEWYKLFIIPGGAHCAPNAQQPNGPWPQNVLQSVIDWVEGGVDPTQLNATVLTNSVPGASQKICSFPLRPLWSGDEIQCVYDQESVDTWLPTLDGLPVYYRA